MTKFTESFIQELREAFDYDPETGVIKWKVSHSPRAKAGAVAGTFDGRGYRKCAYKKVRIKCHKLAWLLVHGREPVDVIDHINGNRSDNRLANLREVSHSENSQNKAAALANNKLGVMGVAKSGNRFCAWISIKRKSRYIGTFDTAEEAHNAYLSAKAALHSGFVPERFSK